MNNARNAASFLVNLYESTGAVKYLYSGCYHTKEHVINMMEMAVINRDRFIAADARKTWPWKELKIAILHAFNWGSGVLGAADYHQLYRASAGDLLTRVITGVDVAVASDAIAEAYDTRLPRNGRPVVAEVLHDLSLAVFAMCRQEETVGGLLRRYETEFSELFGVDSETHMVNLLDNIGTMSRLGDPMDLFYIKALADEYYEPLHNRLKYIADNH